MALSDTHWLWGWALCRLRSNGLHIILRSNPLASNEQPRYSLYIYSGLLCSRPTHPISGEHAHTYSSSGGGSSSKEYNVTSLSLHSHIIRGDGWFSGFLRISAERYHMRMDSFRAVCLPSALSLRRHSRLAHFESTFCSNICQMPLLQPFSLTRRGKHNLRPSNMHCE